MPAGEYATNEPSPQVHHRRVVSDTGPSRQFAAACKTLLPQEGCSGVIATCVHANCTTAFTLASREQIKAEQDAGRDVCQRLAYGRKF